VWVPLHSRTKSDPSTGPKKTLQLTLSSTNTWEV